MKKIALIIFILWSFNGYCQFPNNPTQGSTNTNNQVLGAMTFQKGLVAGTFADTTTANAASYIKTVPFIMISTISPVAIWYRNYAATKWIQFVPNGSPLADTMYWKLGGNDLTSYSNFPVLGATSNSTLYFMTNNLKRLGIAGAGITAATATTSPLGIDLLTGLMTYAPSISSSAWSLLGNAGTVAGTNYLGTSDAINLQLRTSGSKRFTINTSGAFGLGTGEDYGTAGYFLSTNGSGTSPTWTNNTTLPYWKLASGGSLSGNNTIFGTGHSLSFLGLTGLTVTSYPQIQLTGYDGVATANGSTVDIENDSINFYPRLGTMRIDTLALAASSTNRNLMTWNTTNGAWEQIAPTSIATNPAISSLTVATQPNTINNGNYEQRWEWNSSLDNGLTLASSSTDPLGQKILNIEMTGGNIFQDASGIYITGGKVGNNSQRGIYSQMTGASTTNIAGEFYATGGSTNIAASFSRGYVQFGTGGTENGILKIAGSSSGNITIQPQAAAGTYNFNLPITAGTSGQLLLSGGGGASPMTFSTALPNGTTATTQSAGDNSTKVATTAYVATAVAAAPTGITIGTTTITSGTNTRILYNNNGVAGEYTLTGTGTVVAMQNTPTITTPVFTTSAQVPLVIGGTAANDDITINGTSSATKTTSYVNLQPTGGMVGIGTTSPQSILDISSTTVNGTTFGLYGNNSSGNNEIINFDGLATDNTTRQGYAAIYVNNFTRTTGAETGAMSFYTYIGGSLGVKAKIDENGHFVPGSSNNTYDLGGTGNTWRDIWAGRNASIGGTLGVTGLTTVAAFTATGPLSITAGANKSVGQAVLVGGTVTVSNTRVTASSIIFLTDATTGSLVNIGTPTVGTIVAGTSFVINSSNAFDTSTVNWLIIN